MAVTTSKKRKKLPRVFKGETIDVDTLSLMQRKKLGLSTKDTVIEIVGDQKLVEEAVAYAYEKGIIGLDLETSDLDPWVDRIVLCQLGDKERQYLIWWETIDPAPIYELLASDKVVKVGVNLKFDLRFLMADAAKRGGSINIGVKRVVDAMLNSQVLNSGLTGDIGQTLAMTSMGAMALRWMGWELPKDEELRTGWGDMVPGNWDTYRDGTPIPRGPKKKLYAADDVVIPLRVIHFQKPWLLKFDLSKTIGMEMDFLPVLANIEVHGMLLDWDQWMALAEVAEGQKKEAEQVLDKLFDVRVKARISESGEAVYTRDKNYGSPHELRDLLRDWMKEHYGIDVICKNEHLHEALRETGKVNERRLDALFESKMVPNPDKPGSRMQVGYPNMSDVVERIWKDYKIYLPQGSFYLEDTESDTLKVMRIINETPNDKLDPHLPTKVGLPPELVDPILAHREASTKLERYAYSWKELINPVTGRVHSDFTQTAADTGRNTSRPNFQNIPARPAVFPDGTKRDYREPFIAAKGYKIVGSDWAQIEPRIIAEISNDPVYMRTFWSGHPGTKGFSFWCGPDVTEKLDLYIEIGKQIGLIPEGYTVLDCKGSDELGIEAKPEGSKGRKQAKIVVLGLGYGTGPDKFHIMVIKDTGEYHRKNDTDKLYNEYFRAVEAVKRTMDQLSDLADVRKSSRKVWHPLVGKKITYSESLGGRKRFFDPRSGAWWTQGRNHPIQSTGADILKHATIELYRWMQEEEIDGNIINLIHDEIMSEVREDQAEKVKRKKIEIMSKVGQIYCPHVPIDAEGYIADHWVKD